MLRTLRSLCSTLLAVALILLTATMALAAQDATPAPQSALLEQLLNSLAPVIVPAVASGVLWLLNKGTTLIEDWNPWLKRGLLIAFGTVTGYAGARLGLDVSTTQGFAGSIVALLIYHLSRRGK